MRNLDFSSWHALLSTMLGLGLITLVGVGIRLVVMQTIQQRRERANRQINERLRTLIAAYKTLGGSFTGNLAVSPAHLRDIKRAATAAPAPAPPDDGSSWASTDRARRIRDAVEAALSDILLLGTEEQVVLAAKAAADLAAGRSIDTGELVVSLRDFIREVLDLEPVSLDLVIPRQGPTRPSGSGKKPEGKTAEAGGGSKGAGGGGLGGGGMGPGVSPAREDEAEHDR